MDKTDLLKVLDMSEDEQITWFYRRPEPELHNIVLVSPKARFKEYRLADLAFRLRDEVRDKTELANAKEVVWGEWCRITWEQRKANGETKKHVRIHKFWLERSEPIHWIIAAIVAKGEQESICKI